MWNCRIYWERTSCIGAIRDDLSKLEYRGYDSECLAVRDGENEISVVKAKGRLKMLADTTNAGESVPGTCGIGHTSWATYGEPSEKNSHPIVAMIIM